MHSRLTLIAAVLLIIGLPAVAQPKQGWVADPKTGCKVLIDYTKPDDSVTWTGTCPNDIAQGRGTVKLFRSGKLATQTEGEYQDGKLADGKGTRIYVDGCRYEGEFKNESANGHGKYVCPDGTRYEGDFKNDQFEGHGILDFVDGDRYEGEFRNSLPNGRGVMTYKAGNRFEGEFLDGLRNGHGVYIWPVHNRFEGEYRDDKRYGHGVFTLNDGTRFDGEFRDNKPNGHGTLTVDGATYTGNWVNGCFKEGDRTMWLATTKQACGFK